MNESCFTSKSIYYFDTNALWKFYYAQEDNLEIRRVVANSSSQILVSPLTMLEFVGVAMKYYRKKYIKRRDVNALIQRMRRDVGVTNPHRPFLVVNPSGNTYARAESILLLCGESAIQTVDALHLAIALFLNQIFTGSVVFVTSDIPLQHAVTKNGMIFYDPKISGNGDGADYYKKARFNE